MEIRANYKCTTILENTTILKNEFSCILFNNCGTQNAYVNGILVKPDTSISFNENFDVFINTDFLVTFDTDSSKTNNVSIIQTFYKY